jgi:hypothetical protein
MALNERNPNPNPENAKQPIWGKFGAETWVALAATLFSATLLLLAAISAGPLWRDEVNTLSMAQMPTLSEMWHNMLFESFPPLWLLLVRVCGFLGLADGDVSIRILGLYVGILTLVCFWICARSLGCRAPMFSLALLGFLPPFIFIVGANRAYGLATALLLLTFSSLWRVVQKPTSGRILLAAAACVLFAQCVYYDALFLAAMLAGAALVTVRRRQWRTLGWLTAMGAASAASMMIYVPIIHRGAVFVPIMQWPYFNGWTLWSRVRDAVTVRSSAEMGPNGPEIWLWIALLVTGVAVAVMAQRSRSRSRPRSIASATPSSEPAADGADRADRALFCGTSMVLGVAILMTFLFRLHYWTQTWYYIELLCLCSISLDGLLGANWPALRPWGWVRIVFVVAMIGWSARAAWTEAHTRRSDMDLIAALLEKNATEGDLIIVQSVWEGITFNRYYHGKAQWETVPPVNSHLVHRNDLVLQEMNDPQAMEPVLRDTAKALAAGHAVWFVGNMSADRPQPPGPDRPAWWLGTHLLYWNAQISSMLLDHATQEKVLDISAGGPVCCLENLPVIRFTGYRDKGTNNAAAN